jgi:diguanylate cyclase (GGDEF)-like protein
MLGILFIADEREQIASELQKTKRILAIKETELKAIIAQADEVAHTDDLTFLPNRRQIIKDLQEEVIFSERYDTPLSIAMLDLDDFKQINDMHGHILGDEVLRGLADELRKIIRYPDTAGRYAGDVFLLILPHSTIESASELAEHLCQQVRSTPIVSGENNFHITISMGIVQYKIHEEDWRKLLGRADQALHHAKLNGRNRWMIL